MKNLILIFLMLFSTLSYSQLVKVSNTVTKVKPDVYAVRFQVERGSLDDVPYPINTFFKIYCYIPKNVHVVGLDAHGGVFEVEGDTLTYTWYSLPKEDFIEVLFKAKVDIFDDLTDVELTGNYYYLVNEEKQIFDIPKIKLK
jgi:hypothetical protein